MTSSQTHYIAPESLGLKPFLSPTVMMSPWAQTIGSALVPRSAFRFQLRRYFLDLDDGGKIAISEVLDLKNSKARSELTPKSRCCLLVHGLAGDESSPYILRLASLLIQRGYRPFLMNLRGCGPGQGLSKSIYHSGRSEDTRLALHKISELYPQAPITQIGFSLGGNITLKMAGEDGDQPTGNLDSCVSVSAPLDLHASALKLGQKKYFFFDQFFVQLLRLDIFKRHRKFPELGSPLLPLKLTLKEFDDLYTGPRAGFKNGLDYYTQCSSFQFIPKIRIPSLLISAFDDPIIETRFYKDIPHHPSLSVLLTEKGGHVGYLTPSLEAAWHDHAILAWLKKLS